MTDDEKIERKLGSGALHENRFTGELLGRNIGYCPTCGLNFGSDKAFDAHRQGRHGPQRHCVHPADVGLVPRQNAYGATIWGRRAPGTNPGTGNGQVCGEVGEDPVATTGLTETGCLACLSFARPALGQQLL